MMKKKKENSELLKNPSCVLVYAKFVNTCVLTLNEKQFNLCILLYTRLQMRRIYLKITMCR